MMDATIRVRSVAWTATTIVLAVICTLLVTQAWSVGAAPGDADSTFVPTAGCRVTDTRSTSTVGPRSAPLGADQTFTVTIRGANGECTDGLAIPSDAVGVALNVTAVNATTSSNIRIFPADLVDVPLLSNLNVFAGAPPTPNKVDVKLSADGKIKVYNFKGTVNLVIDIVGYYTNSSLKELATGLGTANAEIAALEAADIATNVEIAALESKIAALGSEVDALQASKLDDSNIKWAIVSKSGALLRGKGAVASSRQSLGFFEVVFDSDLSTCSAIASVADMALGQLFGPGHSVALKSSSNPKKLFVSQYSADGNLVADHTFTVFVICD